MSESTPENSQNPARRVRRDITGIPSLAVANAYILQLKIDRFILRSNVALRCNFESAGQKNAVLDRLRNCGSNADCWIEHRRNRDASANLLNIVTKSRLGNSADTIPRALLYAARLSERNASSSTHALFDFEMQLNLSRFIGYKGAQIQALHDTPLDELLSVTVRRTIRRKYGSFDNSDNYIDADIYAASSRLTPRPESPETASPSSGPSS